MPLPKRAIEPIYIARSVYQQEELQSVELETVTNTTLTNIIRQLSSLSKHAEDLFGDLARDVSSIGDRANSLQARIDRLAIKVTQLDSTGEEVPLTDITRKKAFRSAKILDQQIFSRATMPTPMLETYFQCDKPPPLDKLNAYRDDGKDGLKFYTDPNYFFELWRQEMLKDTERVMNDKCKKAHRPKQDSSNPGGGRAHKKKVRTPHNTREKQRQIAIGHGETLMPNNVLYRTLSSASAEDAHLNGIAIRDTELHRQNSKDIQSNYHSEFTDDLFKKNPSDNVTNSMQNNQNRAHFGRQVDLSDGCISQIGISSLVDHHYKVSNELFYHQDQSVYGRSMEMQGAMSPDSAYNQGTPSRTKQRPTQPPPAPPSFGIDTDMLVVTKVTMPTGSRHIPPERESLPPPPPIPGSHMLKENNSNLDSSLPSTNQNIGGKVVRGNMEYLQPINQETADIIAQLKNTGNHFNILDVSQPNSLNDLPIPPPVIDQPSSSSVAPPPPPPPPPVQESNGNVHLNSRRAQNAGVDIINGEFPVLQKINGGITVTSGIQNLISTKKSLPPIQDARTDLMKAIRDGITLRKVEKSEQKENERNNDVASILARRVAIELSESEESESEDDSEGWVESHETSA